VCHAIWGSSISGPSSQPGYGLVSRYRY
jgi:hypothetical protein